MLIKKIIFIILSVFTASAFAADITINSAKWDAEKRKLKFEGTTAISTRLVISNAYNSGQILGNVYSNKEWKIKIYNPRPVPCKIKVQMNNGTFVESNVTGAPKTCEPKAPVLPPVNVPPVANINGPYSGEVNKAIVFSSAGSLDSDGTVVSFLWNFGDNTTSTLLNPTHAYANSGTYTITLTVVDNSGSSVKVESSVLVKEVCLSTIAEHCSIIAYTGPETCIKCHKSEAIAMHGSVHYQQGGKFPNVTNIPKTFLTAGENPAEYNSAVGVNTYCGSHENSPRFTCANCHVGNGRYPMAQSNFQQLDVNSQEAMTELANIDCLTCHQEVYKRFPDWTSEGQGFENFSLLNLELIDGVLVESIGNEVLKTGFSGIPRVSAAGDFLFKPAGKEIPANIPITKMPLTTLAAAQSVHATTRKSCLNCHAGAGGANGAKRGDISLDNINPSVQIDFHMSPAGENLTCSNCHSAGDHRVKGRGLDLRANDVPERFTCDSGSCHSKTPHGDYSNIVGSSIDKHATKIACQTCHIPTYAKSTVGTEIARDWQSPHPSNAACNGRGGWLPNENKGYNLVPVYKWFDGTSKVSYLGENLDNVNTIEMDPFIITLFAGDYTTSDRAFVLGEPNGTIDNPAAKIYPMKEHWGKLARNDNTNTLIAHSTFEFFRTGSFCRAVDVGLGNTGDNCTGIPGSLEMPANTTTVPVFTYQTINHGVEPKSNALGGSIKGCGSCHSKLSGGPNQLDLTKFDYGLRTLPSMVINTRQKVLNGDAKLVCTQCHENKEEGFSFAKMHEKHIKDKKKDCSTCHNFSRPERGLSLTRS